MMPERDSSTAARLVRGVVAGIVAGTIASFTMDRFQAALVTLTSSNDDSEQSESATEKAADAIAHQVAGREIADADKPLAGQAIHYALGIGLGIAYGIAAEFRPAVTGGHGTGFGAVTATLLDEAAVPVVGLGSAP